MRDRSALTGLAVATAYRMEISLTSDVVPVAVYQGTYVTSREYDLEAMYQTIVTEGHQRCSS